MKPGPATSADKTSGCFASRFDRASASTFGAMPAALATTMAALVVTSPWEASRGGSAVTREISRPGVQFTAAIMAERSVPYDRLKVSKKVHFIILSY